jgi:3-hydroxybutyryl-CoA dehydratase
MVCHAGQPRTLFKNKNRLRYRDPQNHIDGVFMSIIINTPYADIRQGQTATYTKTIGDTEVQLFAAVSGDVNPLHLDPAYAATTPFGERIAHGMLTGGLISAAIAMELPGPGTVYRSQSLRFRAPVHLGDTLTVKLEVTDKNDRGPAVTLDCKVYNQNDKLVASGVAEVIAPTERLSLARPAIPEVVISN